jgi:hypothetical protein
VPELNGNFILGSAYRPVSYQAHLRDVWLTNDRLTKSRQPKEYCADLQSTVTYELVTKHQLRAKPAVPEPDAPHPSGNAFDANIRDLPKPHTVDSVANECGMYRPLSWDVVHYQPKTSFLETIWGVLLND